MHGYALVVFWYFAGGFAVMSLAFLVEAALVQRKSPDALPELMRVVREGQELLTRSPSRPFFQKYSERLSLFVRYVLLWPYQVIRWMIIIANGETGTYHLYKWMEAQLEEGRRKEQLKK